MTQTRKRLLLVWIGLWAVWLVLLIQPESRGILRAAVLMAFAGIVFGGIGLFWQRKRVRYGIAIFVSLLVVLLALPGRSVDRENLRASYIEFLKPYEGSAYSWGGENRLGIDCSGLVRKGFICANLSQGLQTLNGRQIREACSLWWFDASAKAMGEEYRGKTVFLFDALKLNTLDHTRLLPGDIAVTESGVHTLVYVGGDAWMQADPGRGRVQYEYIPVDDSGWFTVPMKLLRWDLLHERG